MGGIVVFFIFYKQIETQNTSDFDAHTQSCIGHTHLSDTACMTPTISKIPYADLKSKIEKYITEEKARGTIVETGIYFRDLKNGPTLGINEHTEFTPASMLKVPVLIAYLDIAKDNPEILNTELVISGDAIQAEDNAFDQNYIPRERVEADTPYTIDELLRRLIVFSDNIASIALIQYLEGTLSTNVNKFTEVFQGLGLLPNVEENEFVLSTKRYSQMLSSLYYSAYLPADMSEKALALLEESEYENGLVAGLPKDLRIAHKFGERTILSLAGSSTPPVLRQLHDCGIVYYPENPYLLCVMTRGKEYKELEKFIQTISQMVYEEIESRKIIR